MGQSERRTIRGQGCGTWVGGALGPAGPCGEVGLCGGCWDRANAAEAIARTVEQCDPHWQEVVRWGIEEFQRQLERAPGPTVGASAEHTPRGQIER